ncbi:hypothetical protein UT300003_32290 [Clostridium sardiniense]
MNFGRDIRSGFCFVNNYVNIIALLDKFVYSGIIFFYSNLWISVERMLLKK